MNRDDGNGDGRDNVKQTIAMRNFVFTETGYFDPQNSISKKYRFMKTLMK
jgi:hypothetical protein